MENRRQATTTLRQFKAGNYRYGFIEGPLGYIVTENDFCHQVRSLNENIELRAYAPWECDGTELRGFQVFTVAQIREIAAPIPSYREWAHYWGIKSRVGANYNDFLKSLLEVGVDARAMPKWGEEVAHQQKSATSDLEWNDAIREAQARAAKD